ncbi:MAG: hypothetical protein HQK64_13330 [Desulfamplus sp.]|nr:hypothetical protein [Desulfamplus sp.]
MKSQEIGRLKEHKKNIASIQNSFCYTVEEIEEYINGELLPQKRSEIGIHLNIEKCLRCRKLFMLAQLNHKDNQNELIVKYSPSSEQKILDRLKNRKNRKDNQIIPFNIRDRVEKGQIWTTSPNPKNIKGDEILTVEVAIPVLIVDSGNGYKRLSNIIRVVPLSFDTDFHKEGYTFYFDTSKSLNPIGYPFLVEIFNQSLMLAGNLLNFRAALPPQLIEKIDILLKNFSKKDKIIDKEIKKWIEKEIKLCSYLTTPVDMAILEDSGLDNPLNIKSNLSDYKMAADDSGLSKIGDRELNLIYQSGNFNACIQKALKILKQQTTNNHAVMELIRKIVFEHHHFLTKITLDEINNFIGDEPLFFSQHIEPYENIENRDIENKIGQSCFPAVGLNDSAIYTLKVVDRDKYGLLKSLSHSESQLLDITGAALFLWLNGKNGLEQKNRESSISNIATIPIIWDPSSYTFIVEDSFNKEANHKVEGSSMGIALLIALFSLLFKEPVPLDIASSGVVRRDGEILPVESIEKKLEAIKRERDFITKIIISDKQKLPENPPEFEYIRVKNVQDVVENLFYNLIRLSLHSLLISLINCGSNIKIDLQKEINKMERQYQDYLIDTCMDSCHLLISYIESDINKSEQNSNRAKGTDIRIEYLFRCYWKLGACYCHKGNISQSTKYFDMAKRLYNENRTTIEPKDYYNFQNSYAVLLKDMFCYQEAESVHLKIDQELRSKELPLKYVGENLSSLSQLYLAQHRYKDAEPLQLKALEYIAVEEQHRNFGYLAQIYIRAKDFDRAQEALKEAKELIEKIFDQDLKTKQLAFYHWIESEYLYKRACSSKQELHKNYERFCSFYKQYKNIAHFSHGLINKFCGLGIALLGDHTTGFELLRKSEEFFDNQIDPMMRLLGVTLSIEKILLRFQYGASDFDINGEITKIINALSLQENIRAFFEKDIKELEDSNSYESDKKFEPILKILISINKKIPY